MAIIRENARTSEAYREYLKLGGNRTIEKLRERLLDIWGDNDTPSTSTLSTWSSDLGWAARVRTDDNVINERALERLRDRLASEAEERRNRRLNLADIQLNAALRAMVVEDITTRPDYTDARHPGTPGTGKMVPIDLLKNIDPAQLRAINDTIRLASETQRVDTGQATQRLDDEMDQVSAQRVRALPAEAIENLKHYLQIDELYLQGDTATQEESDDDDAEPMDDIA